MIKKDSNKEKKVEKKLHGGNGIGRKPNHSNKYFSFFEMPQDHGWGVK